MKTFLSPSFQKPPAELREEDITAVFLPISAAMFRLDGYYPFIYTAKIVLTMATMLFVLPGYRSFRWRLSPLSFAVGGLGGIA